MLRSVFAVGGLHEFLELGGVPGIQTFYYGILNPLKPDFTHCPGGRRAHLEKA